MKRLASILGVLGGIGAILWAMRDRLVSVAISREPEPPALRAPEPTITQPTPTPAAVPSPDTVGNTHPNITDVSGIGPVYATRLEAAGIATVSDLAASDAETVAEAAAVTVARARGWIESAQDLATG